VLQRIRGHHRTRLIPVVIVTNSSAPSDVAAAHQYGTNSYIRKPVAFDQFAELLRLIGSTGSSRTSRHQTRPATDVL